MAASSSQNTVGVKPRIELAKNAGLSTEGGIQTNCFLQTSDPEIFACGDVCCYQSQHFGRGMRLENWRNAEDQADTVARNIVGERKPFDEIPWFWSNQFNFALQVVGFPTLGARTDFKAFGKSQLHDSEGVVSGACALGDVREIAAPIRKLKQMIAAKQMGSRIPGSEIDLWGEIVP